MKLKPSTLFVSLVTLHVLASCGSGDNKNKSDEFEKAKSLGDEIQGISHNIPPPAQIPYLLMQTGAEYNESLINSREKAEEYGTQMEKAALNLGVYAADIGYLCSYEKTQESIDYLNTCKLLASDLGVDKTFDQAVLQRFEANIGNKDSLAALLNDAIKKTDQYLNGNSQSKLAALLVTGSFVESLYISTGLIKSYPKDVFKDPKQRMQVLTPLMNIVLDQQPSISEVSQMLDSLEEKTGPIQGIIDDLNALAASYKALNMAEQKRIVGSKLVFDDTTLGEITKLVEKLRTGIVK